MITKDIKQTIKEYFFNNPTKKMRVREIERVLKLSLPSVIRYCAELEEESILTKMKIGNVNFYLANKTSKEYLLEKKFHNLRKIENSGMINFLKKELSNPAIVLFGSYSKGEDLEESDIDIYLESTSSKKLDLRKFEKILERNIQPFKYKSLKEIKNPHLANNILNGIILNNQIEVFK